MLARVIVSRLGTELFAAREQFFLSHSFALSPERMALALSPLVKGAAKVAAGYLVPLPILGHWLLASVSGRFFRRAPTQCSPCFASLLPFRGLPG
jgi:hypothetical protein